MQIQITLPLSLYLAFAFASVLSKNEYLRQDEGKQQQRQEQQQQQIANEEVDNGFTRKELRSLRFQGLANPFRKNNNNDGEDDKNDGLLSGLFDGDVGVLPLLNNEDGDGGFFFRENDDDEGLLENLGAKIFNRLSTKFIPAFNDVLEKYFADGLDPIEVDYNDTKTVGGLGLLDGLCTVGLELDYKLGALSGLGSVKIVKAVLLPEESFFDGGEKLAGAKNFEALFHLMTNMEDDRNLDLSVGAGFKSTMCGLRIEQFVEGTTGIFGANFDMRVRVAGTMGMLGEDAEVNDAELMNVTMNYNSLKVSMKEEIVQGIAMGGVAVSDSGESEDLQKYMSREVEARTDMVIDSIPPKVEQAVASSFDDILPFKLLAD